MSQSAARRSPNRRSFGGMAGDATDLSVEFMTNGSPPVRFGGVRFTGLRKGLEHARFRCPGAPRRRQTRRLNTEPQSWLHSGAGETLARKSPAGAGLSQRMRACPEGGKSTDTIPQAVARRTRDSRRLVGRDSHRTRGLGGRELAPLGSSQRL